MPMPRLHQLSIAPEQLPPIEPTDLVKAWKAATLGAEVGIELQSGDIEGVSFRTDAGETRFLFADLDASCWAAALDRLYGLDNLRGIAVLFRLLALIEIMSHAEWLRPLFSIGDEDGATLHPALVRAAAEEPLSARAQFHRDRFQRRLALEANVESARALPMKTRL